MRAGGLKRGGHPMQPLLASAQDRVLPEGDQPATQVVWAQAALLEQGPKLEREQEEAEQEGRVRGWVGFNPPETAGTRVSPDAAESSQWS